MGILSFYRWIRQVNGKPKELPPAFRVDNLFIDLNTLLHDVASVIYQYAFDKPGLIDKSAAEMLDDYLAELNNTFERILGNYPTTKLFICGDGALNAAKLYQNKKRRYESRTVIKNTKGEEVFRGALLSPGTELMRIISDSIKKWSEGVISSNGFPDLKLIHFSDYNVPGEGEHKIGDIIRSDFSSFRGKKNAVVGKDSDLFLICMLMTDIDMILLRLKDIDSVNGETFNIGQIDIVFRMYEVRDTIATSLNLSHEVFAINFTVISCLFGNDFLPPLLCLNDLNPNMKPMMDIMSQYNKPLIVDDKLDLAGLYHILEILYPRELGMISAYSEKYKLTKSSLTINERDDDSAQKSTKGTIDKTQQGDKSLDQTNILLQWISKGYPVGMAESYYRFHLKPIFNDYNKNLRYVNLIKKYEGKVNLNGDNRIYAMCMRFVQGMKWVYDYYKHGISKVSSKWIYVYPCSPMVTELRDVVGSMSKASEDLVTLSVMTNFIQPEDQQVATFPAWLLPFVDEKVKVAFSSRSPLLDLFPISYPKYAYKAEIKSKDGTIRKVGIHEIIFMPPSDYLRILGFGNLIGTNNRPLPTDTLVERV